MGQRLRGVDTKMRLVAWLDGEEEERKLAWILNKTCRNRPIERCGTKLWGTKSERRKYGPTLYGYVRVCCVGE